MDSVRVDNNEILKAVSNILIRARKQSGLSFRQIEQATGVSKSTLSRIECCKGEPKLTTYIKLMTLYKGEKHE